MKTLTAITGGIGAGKSVVCRVLRTLGYHVYDCDSAARRIMDTDTAIQQRLIDEVDTLAVTDGIVDRPRIARIVFADARKLDALNAIVHAAVLADIADWVFTCLLYTSPSPRDS